MHMQGRDGVLETWATTCVVSETMKPQTHSEQREPMSQNGLVFFFFETTEKVASAQVKGN